MRTYMILTAGLLLAVVPAMGQNDPLEKQLDASNVTSQTVYSDSYLHKAFCNYTMALNSTNDGLVESTIAYLAYLRLNMPQADLKDLGITISGLAESGRTPVIRYKAYLATMIFESPKSFSQMQNTNYTDSNEFFSSVASHAQRTLLGQNIK